MRCGCSKIGVVPSHREIRAVLFDLYETLITEVRGDQPPSRVVATVGDQLGISNDVFRERWRALRAARMTTRLPF